jgi:hypothetical protein
MSDPCTDSADILCGCCTGVTRETPEAIVNRPALPAITYRVGRYATFNASMLASLSDSAHAPMRLLRTRDSGDFSIALLDAWAVTLDTLTFYQERFANEAFLRTAVEQRSVFELARLIGYVPSPGVAASATLAFTLSDAPGSPDNVLIPAGTRVQSVPGPGQKPQVFETSADLTAKIGYNALPAQTTSPWQLSGGDTSTWVEGTANKLNVGDTLLFVRASGGNPISTGPGDVHHITDVRLDPVANITRIAWDRPLSGSFPAGLGATDVRIYVFRKKAALYGVQAPNAVTLPQSVAQNAGGYVDNSHDWNYFQYRDGTHQINLDASYSGLTPGPETPQWIVLTGLGYTSYFRITAVAESNPKLFTLTSKTTQLTLTFGQILTGDTALTLDEVLWEFVGETRDITAYIQSDGLTPAGLPLLHWALNPGYQMQAGMVAPVSGGSITVEGGQRIAVGQPLGVSGKRVRLQALPLANATFTPAHSNATLTVSASQIFLVDAYPPASDPVTGLPAWQVRNLTGIPGTLVIDHRFVRLQPADKGDPLTGEATVVGTVVVDAADADFTTLGLKAALIGLYDASTVTVNANAVNATHGETVQEILGSGSAANDRLQFTLKQSPLTYTTAATGTGVQSTLNVWVNNLRWQEVPKLLTSGPADRVFVTRSNPAGNVIVQFGNGQQGARTPTGQLNIRAVYRKGIGTAGMVNAGQLTQPLDRPQGVTSVNNPGAASGGADPATADDARARAPLPTLTIGRVVSLEDYQNFALAFAGIAKAVATWTWFSGTRGVFLTVAGQNGAILSADDPIVANLLSALRALGNPYVPLQVVSYSPINFQLAANIKVDQTQYDFKQVMVLVWQNLAAHFAFDQRLLGQNATASEVVRVIQQTPGILATRLTGLFVSGSPSTAVPTLLCASGPMPPLGAQLLRLDPASQGNLGGWS